jgi:NodT family efflux transporter outer membrane factor (OMF) lipoprotein
MRSDSAIPCCGRRFVVAALAISTFVGGCTVGPDYVKPEAPVPDAWHERLADGMEDGRAGLHSWWTMFDDPALDRLIEMAGAGNLTLKEAVARIAEAEAEAGVAKGALVPSVDSDGDVTRARESDDFATPGRQKDTRYGMSVDASWEVDLWGRIRRSVESAEAGVQASVEDYRDVLVLLFRDVAVSYVEVRTLQARIKAAKSNVEAQQDTLALVEARNEAELVGKLDVRQAELNLATTESAIPPLRASLDAEINRLGVLVGQLPSSLYPMLSEVEPIPAPEPEIAVGVPAELLRQRPDIRRAERLLASQTAAIGVATAELYPQFTLSGTFGYLATSDLFDWSNRTWGFGPAFRWNLFDGGRIRSRIKVEDARAQQALARYEQTVLSAYEEVETSLSFYIEELNRREALRRSVVAARESVALVNELYKSGLTDFQNILDTERALFQQEDAMAASSGFAVQSLIGVYTALGGGWKVVAEADAAAGESDATAAPQS